MSGMLQLPANVRGRDLAVGDVHGHFRRLRQALDEVGFDPVVDRLISVGDLVDRGPDSEQVLEWLQQPWLFAVQGNHEALAIAHVRGQSLGEALHRNAGGAWFLDRPAAEQFQFAERFARMPLAMQIETASGPVGVVHADCPFSDWAQLRAHLQGAPAVNVQELCQWSRKRLQEHNDTPVAGVRALIVGHTPSPQVRVLGNVWHIDTGGWSSGHFTLLDVQTLTVLA